VPHLIKEDGGEKISASEQAYSLIRKEEGEGKGRTRLQREGRKGGAEVAEPCMEAVLPARKGEEKKILRRRGGAGFGQRGSVSMREGGKPDPAFAI